MAIGFWQAIIILAIVLILFGAGKLPQVMSDIGRGLGNLRRAMDNTVNEGVDGNGEVDSVEGYDRYKGKSCKGTFRNSQRTSGNKK